MSRLSCLSEINGVGTVIKYLVPSCGCPWMPPFPCRRPRQTVRSTLKPETLTRFCCPSKVPSAASAFSSSGLPRLGPPWPLSWVIHYGKLRLPRLEASAQTPFPLRACFHLSLFFSFSNLLLALLPSLRSSPNCCCILMSRARCCNVCSVVSFLGLLANWGQDWVNTSIYPLHLTPLLSPYCVLGAGDVDMDIIFS